MPISTFPCHDYDEDEYILKPAGLRDTHSEGKVIQTMQDFAETYRTASGDEIARLHGQIDSLTAPARESLLVEIQRRNLTEGQLAQTREQLAQHVESVNQKWQESRRVDAARAAKRFAIRVAVVIAGAILATLFALNKMAH
jgi:hypothetical protein